MEQQKPKVERGGPDVWIDAVAIALIIFGVIGSINGTPTGALLLIVGAIGLVIGFVLRSSRKRNALLERQTAALERQVALEEERRRQERPPV